MSSTSAPYATSHNHVAAYEEREKVERAPWLKDQRSALLIATDNGRTPGYDAIPYLASETAPFATSENLPAPLEMQSRRKLVSKAPWDRDESHYSNKVKADRHPPPSVQIKCGKTSSSAPFATELSNHI